MNGKIIIPVWLEEGNPQSAKWCEVINDALQKRPNMSLAQFAEGIDRTVKETSLKRVQEAEKRQFDGV